MIKIHMSYHNTLLYNINKKSLINHLEIYRETFFNDINYNIKCIKHLEHLKLLRRKNKNIIKKYMKQYIDDILQ